MFTFLFLLLMYLNGLQVSVSEKNITSVTLIIKGKMCLCVFTHQLKTPRNVIKFSGIMLPTLQASEQHVLPRSITDLLSIVGILE